MKYKINIPFGTHKVGDIVDSKELEAVTLLRVMDDVGLVEEVEWEEGDEYWYVGELGIAILATFDNDNVDKARKNFLGIFRTYKEAIERRDKVLEFIKGLK